MKHLKEEWKPVKGFEGLYKLSNYGNVISLAKEWATHQGGIHKKGITILKPKHLMTNGEYNGYKFYTFCKKGIRLDFLAHTLVYDHFGVGKRNGKKIVVDHIDEDKSNNRIDNLQLLTARKNISKSIATTGKTSKYVGVYWHSRDKKWGTQIHINDGRVYLGLFETEKEAYEEYQRALKEFESIGAVTSKIKKRICTNRYKGVSKVSNSKNWRARITINSERIDLGCFPTEYEAHIAYKKVLTDGGQV